MKQQSELFCSARGEKKTQFSPFQFNSIPVQDCAGTHTPSRLWTYLISMIPLNIVNVCEVFEDTIGFQTSSFRFSILLAYDIRLAANKHQILEQDPAASTDSCINTHNLIKLLLSENNMSSIVFPRAIVEKLPYGWLIQHGSAWPLELGPLPVPLTVLFSTCEVCIVRPLCLYDIYNYTHTHIYTKYM